MVEEIEMEKDFTAEQPLIFNFKLKYVSSI